MKRNTKFFTIVMSLILLSAIILTGCMYAIAADNGGVKPYDLNIVSGRTNINDSPTSQSDLQRKFSNMSKISETGRAITVISKEFLDNYWQSIGIGQESKALTTEEVIFIIQDSIRLYFEYEEYTLCGNMSYLNQHAKLVECTSLPNGTITLSTLDEGMLENNFDVISEDIHRIILYRLAALSTTDSFIFADEAMKIINCLETPDSIFLKSIFYVPSDAPVKDYNVLAEFINGKIDDTKHIKIFDICYCGDTRVMFYADGSNSDSVADLFPTAEMMATQANRVVDIVDLTVTQGIPTDQAIELFYETEKFEYCFPSIRSQYVMAIMYDGREMPLTEALENGYITPFDFDSFDFDYIRKVKHKENNGEIYEYPFNEFYVQTVYTDKLRKDGIYPYANLINSSEEMRAYTKEIKANKVCVTDRGTANIPSYDEWVTKYTNAWFEKNSLIIVVVESDSDVIPGLSKIQIEPDTQRIDLYLKEENLGSQNDQVYTLFLEMSKTEAEIINIFEN
ncbi:MAG: hypothetical protein IJB49_06950 [Clostridia bacterium]|nr:hypothetical protein [Clostridia bacterium]